MVRATARPRPPTRDMRSSPLTRPHPPCPAPVQSWPRPYRPDGAGTTIWSGTTEQSTRRGQAPKMARFDRRSAAVFEVGIHLPQFGRASGVAPIARAARLAEDRGFAGL